MEVVSLFPSIEIDFTVHRFIGAIVGSDTEFRDENTNGRGVFFRLDYSEYYLIKHGLDLSFPCPIYER